jgi:hypothetical protein
MLNVYVAVIARLCTLGVLHETGDVALFWPVSAVHGQGKHNVPFVSVRAHDPLDGPERRN